MAARRESIRQPEYHDQRPEVEAPDRARKSEAVDFRLSSMRCCRIVRQASTLRVPRAAVMVSCVVMMASVAPSVARADTPEGPDDDATRQRVADQIREDAKVEEASHDWFGGTIIGLDAATALATDILFDVATNSNSSTVPAVLGATSLVGYLFGAPTVHWVHGQLGLGFASFGLHVAGTFGGIATEFVVGDARGDGVTAGGAVLAGLIFAIPTVLDASLLSTTHTKHEWTTKAAWTPTFQVRRGGATAGFAAEF
jgi:hypothetical protein